MKNMAKKFVSLLLAAVMIFGVIATGTESFGELHGGIVAFADGWETEKDNLTWSFNESTGVLTISGTGNMADYPSHSSSDIPWYSVLASIKSIEIGSGVTSIGSYAFGDCVSLTSINIPNNVTSIGNGAFTNCTSLTSITISNSMVSIGRYAFYNTGYYNNSDNWKNGVLYIGNALIKADSSTVSGSVAIKSGTTYIADGAFEKCASLTSVTIPNSVISISQNAFLKCTNLTKATIGNGVKNIGDNAFRYCSSLTSINIPNSVTSMGEAVFYECKNLASVTIGNSVTDIGGYAFFDCTSLTSITIPNSVTSIEYMAFYGCTSLMSVSIPDSVTSISSPFEDCTSLTKITVAENNKYYSSDERGALFDKDKTELIQYPVGNTGISYTIPSSVTKISFRAFKYCSSLASIIMPIGVTEIGSFAFYRCSNLTDINYYGSEEDWKQIQIYDYNDSLTNATIHYNYNTYISNGFVYVLDENIEIAINDFIGQIDGSLVIPDMIDGYPVTSIGKLAFSYLDMDEVIFNCTHLETIGDGAFTGCANLTEITIPDGVTSIGANGFSYNDNLTTVNIPDSVEFIGESCFEYSTSLNRVNWGTATLTEIQESTFEGCIGLEEITIPPNVAYIHAFGFAYCENLVTVINDAIALIGIENDVFLDCIALEGISGTEVIYGYIGPGYSALNGMASSAVILPHGLETIGERAFENCVSIKRLTIPATVKSIGDSAFNNCTGIEEVSYTGTGMGWNSIDIQPNNSALYADYLYFKGSLIYNPSTTTVKYGETLGLHANADGLPAGAKIEWSADSDAVSLKPTSDSKSCGVTSEKSGDVIITAKAVYANGNPLIDANGDEISSTQKITSKAGLWQKIVSFFKNLFGVNRVIPQSVKTIF